MVDYIEFWVFPSQNRYEACIFYHNKIETVASGVLEPLAMHSPKIKALCSRGSDETFKLQPPENLDDAKWFTRSALMRFVHIISSSEVLDKVKAMENEISQLEESLKFHASIYAKGDDTYVAPDASKNELLRAMELRLTALRGELESAWHQAVGSSEEITAILKFCRHFGAVDLSNSLQKFLGLSQEDMPANVAEAKDSVPETGPTLQSETPVIYGASPAKAAQIERQSSSEGEESSCISEEDQPSVERSRPLTRSASPRRSASPMRRIQIGRSGTRRSTALTIKSLSHFPAAREKLVCQEKSDEEESELTSRTSENNVCRMSVQDRISLFEGKQKAQTDDTQKTKSVLNTANKAVLRRWSAGMGDSSSPAHVSSDNPQSIEPGQEILSASEPIQCPDSCTSGLPPEKPDVCGERVYDLPVEREEGNEMEVALAERTCQKGEEVNPPQIAMTNAQPEGLEDGKDRSFPSEQAVRPSNHRYKEKGNEKVRGESDRTRVERKTPRSNLDEGIAVKKTQRTLKNSPQSANPKDETSKPGVVKRVSSAKASPLPATRKSWPSTPSPRAPQVKTPPPRAIAGAIPATRRSKPIPSVPQSSQKLERSQQPEPTSVKASPSDTKKSVKSSMRKQQNEVIGASKHTKTKVKANEVTKKSSMAPLEPKEPAKKPRPFLHKDSRIRAKTKISPPVDPLRDSGDSGRAKENEMASVVYEHLHQNEDNEVKVHADLETETQLNTLQKYEETGSSNPVTSDNEVDFQSTHMSAVKDDSEDEPNISPGAKIEEHEDEQIPSNTTASHSESLATEPESAAIPHESSEPDDVAWGNAENPPTMVYQKDSPKGLKKLLKFARKSNKTDTNTTRLSSQSVISKREDVTEETIALRKDGDNLLKKATSHTKNYGNKIALSSESRTKDPITHGVSATRSYFSLSAFKGTKQNDPLVH